jgi:hypothetical protein
MNSYNQGILYSDGYSESLRCTLVVVTIRVGWGSTEGHGGLDAEDIQSDILEEDEVLRKTT